MGDEKYPNKSVREQLEKTKEKTGGMQKINMQFFAENGDGNKLTKLHKALLAGLVVVAVGIVCTFVVPKPEPNDIAMIAPVVEASSTAKEDKNQYDADLEKRLEEILGQIEGVGNVDVMVTLATSKEKVLAEEKNINTEKTDEKDSTGGTRTTNKENTQNKVIMADGNKPYVVKEQMPAISGVLVVAEGGDDSYIKSAIIDSVSSLLGIPVHKVSVFKMGKN
ncbi:MAG: hypothetical protein ACRC1P_07090 [Cellulosilyticaceae bacterium]